MWEFVEKKAGTGASGTITFSGLDGDTDKMYRVVLQGVQTGFVPVTVFGYFNGASTNMGTNTWYNSGGTWTKATTAGFMALVDGGGARTYLDIVISADKTTGEAREFRSFGKFSTFVYWGTSWWTDTTTNLTSFSLVVSNNWQTDTEAWLYKLAQPDG